MERTTLTERLRRAESEIAAGRPEQALANCQELQTAYPRALRVQRVLGEIYLALRRPREALAALDRALAGDPEDVRACCARALVHQIHGDDVSALAWYRRACDLRPNDQALRATYHELARRLGEPAYRPSRSGLARLYLRGDLFSHAIREWEQLVVENPDMVEAQVGLAETLWISGHLQAAEERCRRILANSPSCVKAMLIQMALALAEGDMDAARAHLDRTLQLDPDMAIAHVLFADALAAGDPVMSALLRVGSAEMAAAPDANGVAPTADVPIKQGRPTIGFAPSQPLAGQRNLSRPLVSSIPANENTLNVPPPNQPLPPPPRPDIPVPSQPTEVTRAIKETAFMIWGSDDDSQPRLAATPSATGGDGEPIAPPVLRSLGDAMDDQERQQALNWYNWLQAKGAVALGAAMQAPPAEHPHSTTIPIVGSDASGNGRDDVKAPPSLRVTMPIPPAMPVVPLPPTEALFAASPADEPETAKLPLPSSEALRSMFAELGGDTSVLPIVQAASAPSAPPMPPAREQETPAIVESSYDAPVHTAGVSSDLPEAGPAIPPFAAAQSIVDAAPEPREPHESYPQDDQRESDEQPNQTIEELERQFAASGFTPIETRPGLLAEINRTQQPPGSGEHPISQPESQPETPTASETPTAEPTLRATVAKGPDPRDYPARLAHARQRRDDGQLDEALNEYRAIIKNAPDLLPEVLADLRASLADLPDHASLHGVLGDALVSQGDYEAALESFNRATELSQSRSGN
ncbi:MAG TPA: tetratricopeptide repeat protein [Ktedonobacterales bacterium]|nr:tetratricopeptide repeat protein [Ktedonobacterales bacterium]